MNWVDIATQCGFIHFTHDAYPPGVKAMRFGRLRLDVFPSGQDSFTARLIAGISYRDEPLAGATGNSEDEAFQNLLDTYIGPGEATVSDVIGATATMIASTSVLQTKIAMITPQNSKNTGSGYGCGHASAWDCGNASGSGNGDSGASTWYTGYGCGLGSSYGTKNGLGYGDGSSFSGGDKDCTGDGGESQDASSEK